ncbi:MAG: ATP-binding cassette domain-containing protein [bacterium]|nr:ATP-binding cassette domain-containing protein [bacterium]
MVLEAKNVSKSFSEKTRIVKVVENFSYTFPSTGFVCFLGESGTGKTTLMNMLSSLLKPDEGCIRLDGENIYFMHQKKQMHLRANSIGFVFQENNLLEDFTVLDNLRFIIDDDEQISDCLKKLNILSLKNVLVSKLSGGEKQRVAIARCFLKKSKIIFLDEPIASLDERNANEVIETIKTVSKTALCLVSLHNQTIADLYADVIIRLFGDGKYHIYDNIDKEKHSSLSQHQTLINDCKQKQNQKIMLLFAWKNLWSRKTRTFLLILISLISMTFSLLQGSFLFFDTSVAFSEALKEENAWIIPLKQLRINNPTQEDVSLKCGINFFQESKKEFGKCVPVITGKESKYNTTLYYIPFVEGLTINNQIVQNPKSGQCVVSSFLKNLASDSLSSSIYSPFGSFDVSFEYQSIIEVDFSASDMSSHIMNINYQITKKDTFLTNYSYVIMNENDFYTIYNSFDSLFLKGASFANESLTMKEYVDSTTIYSKFSNQQISFGSQPKKNDDVVVSKRYLASLGIETKDYNSILNKQFHYRDLSSSPNYVNYEQTPNIYLIKDSVTICGITDLDSADIYISTEFYSNICSMLPYYSFQIAAITDNYLRTGSILKNASFKGELDYLKPIYLIEQTKTGPLSGIFITLAMLFFFLTAIIGVSIGLESVSGKEKRIAMLMSLGKDSNVLSRFLLMPCVFLQIISYAFSSLASLFIIVFINKILMKESVLGISYNLFRLESLSMVICLAIATLSIVFSLLFVVKKISKVDIAYTLKGKV